MKVIDLIENEIPESQTLEYKSYQFEDGKFSKLTDRDKNGLAKEITAFANSEGGTIVIGISEDGNHNPLEFKDTGVDESTFEMWEQSFRQYISAKIKPVLYGIECKLEKHQDSNIIIITVPKSLIKPHAFDDGNKDTFHIRYGNTVNVMRLEELRTSFQSRELIEQRILDFRDERIAKLYSGEQIGELGNNSAMLLHIIPEWSMYLNHHVNLTELKENYKLDVFSPTPSGNSVNRVGRAFYNHEGLRIEANDFEGELASYTQAFSNGIIESVEINLMNLPSRNNNSRTRIYQWNDFEQLLAIKLERFTKVLIDQGIPKPMYIFVSLVNVQGKFSIIGDLGVPTPSGPLTQNIIKITPGYLSSENTFSEAIYPLMTNLAHVFGLEKSLLYNAEGKVIEVEETSEY